MRFPTDISDREVPDILRRFVRLAGREPWKKRLTWVQRELKKPTGMQHFSRERWWLELAFAKVWQRCKRGRPIAAQMMAAEEVSFLSCAAAAVQCHERLTHVGRQRLKGMLLDATNQPTGLGPFAYEMKIAVHLMSRGYDVEFHDLEGGRGFDYLATKDGVSAEVECKFMSGDLGRKIHLMRLAQFSEKIAPKMFERLDSLRSGIFVRLTIPDRLEGEKQQLELSALVERTVARRATEELSDGTQASVQEFDVRSVTGGWGVSSRLDKAQIEASLRRHFGLENNNVLIHVQPDRSAVVVVVESVKEDHVLRGMLKGLKRAAKFQFSGRLPGVLCCHLADLTHEQLVRLAEDGSSGLNPLATKLFDSRPDVYSITFTAQGSVRSDACAVSERAPAYTFKNTNHAQRDNAGLSLFAEGWP